MANFLCTGFVLLGFPLLVHGLPGLVECDTSSSTCSNGGLACLNRVLLTSSEWGPFLIMSSNVVLGVNSSSFMMCEKLVECV